MRNTIRYRMGLLLVGVLVSLAPSASADLLLYEPFDYAGAGLNGQGGGELGLAGTWQDNIGLAPDSLNSVGAVGLSDDATSLAHPSLPASQGARVSDDGADGGTAKRALDGFTVAWNTNNAWYISALVRGSGLIQFQNDLYNRISFGINDSGQFQVGFKATDQRAMSSTYAGGARSYDPAATYLLVAKAIASTISGQDRMVMNVYDATMPPPAVEPELGSWELNTGLVNSGVVMNTISLAFYSSLAGQIDEIRVGTEWADVAPEPGSLLLLAAAGLGVLRRRRRAA